MAVIAIYKAIRYFIGPPFGGIYVFEARKDAEWGLFRSVHNLPGFRTVYQVISLSKV